MTMQTQSRCTCPLRGSGDAMGCYEVSEAGSTPLLRPGDVLDGVIVVGDGVVSATSDLDPYGECRCLCHDD